MPIRPLFPLAVVLVAIALPAVAQPSDAGSVQDSRVIFGSTSVAADQETLGTATLSGGLSTAVGAYALSNAHGNAGLNLAAGAMNMQTNEIALAAAPVTSVSVRQVAQGSGTMQGGGSAVLGAHALEGAGGNIGVNVAAGFGNVQANVMAIR